VHGRTKGTRTRGSPPPISPPPASPPRGRLTTTRFTRLKLLDTAKAGKGAIAQDGDIAFYNAYYISQIAERYVGAGWL